MGRALRCLPFDRQRSANVLNPATNLNPTAAMGEKVVAFQPGSDARQYALFREYCLLRTHSADTLRGVVVVPTKDESVWKGVLHIHQGPFEGAVIRFLMKHSDRFPLCPPIIQVEGSRLPEHPLISPESGEVDLSLDFGKWDPRDNRDCAVLAVFKNMFFRPYLLRLRDGGDDVPNRKALELIRRNYKAYEQEAGLFAKDSREGAKQESESSNAMGELSFARPRHKKKEDVVRAIQDIFEGSQALSSTNDENDPLTGSSLIEQLMTRLGVYDA